MPAACLLEHQPLPRPHALQQLVHLVQGLGHLLQAAGEGQGAQGACLGWATACARGRRMQSPGSCNPYALPADLSLNAVPKGIKAVLPPGTVAAAGRGQAARPAPPPARPSASCTGWPAAGTAAALGRGCGAPAAPAAGCWGHRDRKGMLVCEPGTFIGGAAAARAALT